MKYKHILFPTDGSKCSEKAMEHVKKIACTFLCDVTVICAYSTTYSINPLVRLPKEIYDNYKKELDTQAKVIAEKFVSELVPYGISVNHLVIEGNPKKIICEYAERLGCDLIIMGTRGHSESSGYLGSTSSYVINNVHNIPVMVVN